MNAEKQVQLSEIAELITKGTTPTTIGFDFQDKGVNFLRIECFSESGNLIRDKLGHISEECHAKLKRSQLEDGDILFSIAGAIGRVAIVTKEMLPANTNQALAIIRINRKDVFLPYIKLILTSPIVRTQFERKKQGVAQLNISLKDLNELEIPLPKFDKQMEYATLFGKVSSVVGAYRQQLQNLDNLVKARFVEMFGDLVSGNKIKTNRHKIGDIAFVTKLAGFEFTKYVQYKEYGDIIMLRGLNCKKGKLILDDIKWIDKTTSDLLPRSKLHYGDILMTYAGTIGDVAMVDADNKYHLAPNVAKITLKEKLYNPVFLMHLFLYTNDYIMSFASKVAQASINMEKIRNFEYFFPDADMQNQFAAFVEQTNKSKEAIQKALVEAQLLFDSLMQKYFG